MTEAEFIDWSPDEGVRVEWVDGEVIFKSPVSEDHADLSVFMIRLLGGFVEENDLGKIWHEPFQIRLVKQRRRRSPDLFFAFTERLHLCEKSQFNGAPDLIVEIISPDSKIRDRRIKFAEYQAVGVREYWIVDPLSRRFEAFTLHTGGKYELIVPSSGSTDSVLLPGLFFRSEWVGQANFPKISLLLKQMSANRKKLLSTRRRRSSDKQL